MYSEMSHSIMQIRHHCQFWKLFWNRYLNIGKSEINETRNSSFILLTYYSFYKGLFFYYSINQKLLSAARKRVIFHDILRNREFPNSGFECEQTPNINFTILIAAKQDS